MFQKNNQQSNTVLFRKRSLSHFVAIWPWVNINKAKKRLLGKPSVLPLKKNKRAQKKSKPNKTVLCLFLVLKTNYCWWMKKKSLGWQHFVVCENKMSKTPVEKPKEKKPKLLFSEITTSLVGAWTKKKVLFFYFVFFFLLLCLILWSPRKKERAFSSLLLEHLSVRNNKMTFSNKEKKACFWNKVLKLLLFLFCNTITIHYWVGRSFKSWLFCITYITG